jgi:hypothetical protein
LWSFRKKRRRLVWEALAEWEEWTTKYMTAIIYMSTFDLPRSFSLTIANWVPRVIIVRRVVVG